METLLSDLARSGALPNAGAANKLAQNAIALVTKGGGGSNAKLEDPEATSLVLSLFVEATRQKISGEDFTSTCSDYFPDPVTQALKTHFVAASATNTGVLSNLQSTFFTDLPHCVGVSSTVQHHVRDFAVKVTNANEEKPRSVANFVFALDLAQRGTIVSGGGGDGASSSSPLVATEGDISQVVFQCTGEQAQELAASLRAAAAALDRAEVRVQQQ